MQICQDWLKGNGCYVTSCSALHHYPERAYRWLQDTIALDLKIKVQDFSASWSSRNVWNWNGAVLSLGALTPGGKTAMKQLVQYMKTVSCGRDSNARRA